MDKLIIDVVPRGTTVYRSYGPEKLKDDYTPSPRDWIHGGHLHSASWSVPLDDCNLRLMTDNRK